MFHDIRNILQKVMSASQILMRNRPGIDRDSLLQQILNNTKELNQKIESVREASSKTQSIEVLSPPLPCSQYQDLAFTLGEIFPDFSPNGDDINTPMTCEIDQASFTLLATKLSEEMKLLEKKFSLSLLPDKNFLRLKLAQIQPPLSNSEIQSISSLVEEPLLDTRAQSIYLSDAIIFRIPLKLD